MKRRIGAWSRPACEEDGEEMKLHHAMAAALVCVLFVGCSQEMNKSDIKSVSMPLKDQQEAVWKFEKELQCDCFGPCFYAMVDGALEDDPERALRLCNNAYLGLKKLSVPAGLPIKVTVALEESRLILQRHALWMLESARYATGIVSSPAGLVPDNAGTCDAYARIDRVNILYGLKDFMGSSYIDCDVLNKPEMAEFPRLSDLK